MTYFKEWLYVLRLYPSVCSVYLQNIYKRHKCKLMFLRVHLVQMGWKIHLTGILHYIII